VDVIAYLIGVGGVDLAADRDDNAGAVELDLYHGGRTMRRADVGSAKK
jgi:hypothetical protein